MLTTTIALPLVTALFILTLPAARPVTIRWTALGGAGLTLMAALVLVAGYVPGGPLLQWRTTVAWIPSIGAAYDIAVDGLGLALVVLTAVLLCAVMLYVLRDHDRPKAHAALFLVLATGLLGVWSAQDLLLFYLFFEISLVPMYFIVGGWGHERRHYAAMKFFLYTRAGSLAMLLSFLTLYLSTEPRTFSLPAIAAAHPLAGAPAVADLVFLGLLIGFGVKLPTFPLHNWLPDAHVEAPTEGSVILAGLQLKLGGYGLLRVALPSVPDAAQRYAWLLVALGLISLAWGVLAALGQRDLKRLIAYTSVNHMGYVTLAAGLWGLAGSEALQTLAITGAGYQIVSHGLLTGGMFFLAGMLQDQTGTREMSRLGGLATRLPLLAAVLAALAFGSLGLPGFSGFIAEFQVIGAAVGVSLWVAVGVVLALIVTTGLYLSIVVTMVLAPASGSTHAVAEPPRRKLAVAGALLVLSMLLGLAPGPLVSMLGGAARALLSHGG